MAGALLAALLAACAGGSNLPSVSRSFTAPSRPTVTGASSEAASETTTTSASVPTQTRTRTRASTASPTDTQTQTSTRTSTETETSTQTETRTKTETATVSPSVSVSASSSPAGMGGGSNDLWPWLIVLLVAAAIGVAWWLRARSGKRAEEEARAADQALRACAEATSAHDQAASVPLSDAANRATTLGEAAARIDRAQASFASLGADPAAVRLGLDPTQLQLALTGVRGFVDAAATAGAFDDEVLRQRLSDLDYEIRRFREAIAAAQRT